MVRPTSGVTLIEMLVVVAVIGIVVSVSIPRFGRPGQRAVGLHRDAIASFLNGAVTHAERSEHPVVVSISLKDGTISADGSDGFARRFQVPQGITWTRCCRTATAPRRRSLQQGDPGACASALVWTVFHAWRKPVMGPIDP